MLTGTRSLMDFVDTPLLVGDPDGRAVYANPAFERDFGRSKESIAGEPLANLFDGGGREAVLKAVAGVCGGEPRVRFRLREDGLGFAALASPVEVEEGRVGVMILLFEDRAEERLLRFRRDVQEPLDDLAHCFVAFGAPDANPRSEAWRIRIAEALRAIERIRKWTDEIAADPAGRR